MVVDLDLDFLFQLQLVYSVCYNTSNFSGWFAAKDGGQDSQSVSFEHC